jgi:hypothetical protein
VDLLKVQFPIVEASRALSPENLTHRERVIQQSTTFTKGEAGGVVFLLLPANPDPEVQAATAQYIEGGRRFGQNNRAAQRRQKYTGGKANPRCQGRHH